MLTSHELIGFMSPALANDILNFTFESDKPAYKATMAAVAETRKLIADALAGDLVRRHEAFLTARG